MNIANNSRFAGTDDKIRSALFSILRYKTFDNISVKDICEQAEINRSSFYTHYTDINDLLIRTEQFLSQGICEILKNNDRFNLSNFEELFLYIKKYKVFYKAYLRYGVESFIEKEMYAKFKTPMINVAREKQFYYNEWELDYLMRFFGAGLKSICARWLEKDCKESPKQIAELINKQYANNVRFFIDQTDNKPI